jgi:hypothetical protein
VGVDAPPDPAPPPTTRLPPSARRAWAVEGLAFAAVVLAAGVFAGVALNDIGGVPGWIATFVRAAALAVAVGGGLVAPQLRYRSWRYAVRDEELDLLRGVLTVVRTVVPVARIQHVETRRTVFSQLFGLAAVHVHTAAGTTAIPYLTEYEAARIRDRIARLARVPDEL